MRIKRSIRLGTVLLSVLALCALLYMPAQAATRAALHTAGKNNAVTSINANVYLTGQMLRPMFQSNINQQLPPMVHSSIAGMVNGLPKQDQGWATQMANALIQPSATLTGLTPQASGLQVSLKVSLYPGDPKPTTTGVLIGFSVADPSTIQVTALPGKGGQSLVSGPLTTFHVPIGSLNSISATPNCGASDLNVNLKFPVTLGQPGQAASQPSTGTAPLAYTRPAAPVSATDSYIEIPASSLAQLGGSIGNMPVSNSLTAENIRVGVQGHDLTITSDIYWYGLNIGTAVSTMTPGTASGNLVVNVLNTSMQILGFITFPVNNYNQQVEQMLNTKLNGALTGKFTVAQAAIGPNPALPCAAANSLVLAGTIALG
jgi:hypothetical protein